MPELKCCFISDTHSLHRELDIPKCDYLFHTGDLTGNGGIIQLQDISNWFYELKVEGIVKEDVICIAGNHDECLSPTYANNVLARNFLKENCTYLDEESYVLINGMTVFGSAYTPLFFDWFFMHPRFEMYDKAWSKIPNNTELLLTHGPAYGILDFVNNTYNDDHHVGCKGLLQKLGELPKLKYHGFGHLHASYGKEVINGITYINGSVCTEGYKAKNKPILIEI